MPAGEVEYFSILDNKSATKNYWETRMLATMDDGGWESVANVRFQPLPGVTPVVLQVGAKAQPGDQPLLEITFVFVAG